VGDYVFIFFDTRFAIVSAVAAAFVCCYINAFPYRISTFIYGNILVTNTQKQTDKQTDLQLNNLRLNFHEILGLA